MEIIRTTDALKDFRKSLEEDVGFVPTMGALHSGHLSLMKKSKEENTHTIVSIFVNPTQFLPGEDLETYPRKEAADIDICRRLGIDVLFMPEADTLYGQDEVLIKAPKNSGYILEGFERPGHFDGVLQVVLKLFGLAQPKRAYFGEKDAQQVLLIERMVKNLFLDIEIIRCDTIREADGLALSSRNIYLNETQRALAAKLSFALKKGAIAIMDGEYKSQKIKQIIKENMQDFDIEYIEIINQNLQYTKRVEKGNSVIVAAVRLGGVRLIDNIWT